MKKSKTNAEHYKWGDNCDGWRLVDTDDLFVIEEKMPPKTAESLHFHAKSQQFFYILEGIATFESENKIGLSFKKQNLLSRFYVLILSRPPQYLLLKKHSLI